MKALERKSRIRRAIYSIPSLVVFSMIVFLLAKGTVRVVGKEWQSSEYSSNLAQEAAALAARERHLQDSIARLQTEKGITEEIREKFSVTPEGEYVAVIVDDRREASSTPVSTLPWYQRLWTAIMGSK